MHDLFNRSDEISLTRGLFCETISTLTSHVHVDPSSSCCGSFRGCLSRSTSCVMCFCTHAQVRPRSLSLGLETETHGCLFEPRTKGPYILSFAAYQVLGMETIIFIIPVCVWLRGRARARASISSSDRKMMAYAEGKSLSLRVN